MKEYFDVMARCLLFDGIGQSEMREMLGCLNGEIVETVRGEPVFLEGDPATFVGIVLAGAVQIVRDDYFGRRSVLTVVEPGGLFAEAFACAGLESLPVSAFALRSGCVLLLDCDRMLNGCASACASHSCMVCNLLRGTARKNLALTRKIRYMSQRTTREKLMEFLLDQAKQQGSPEFVIAYDRQALADYLGVERSAMSAEISKLRRDGIIDSHGSWFRVLADESIL